MWGRSVFKGRGGERVERSYDGVGGREVGDVVESDVTEVFCPRSVPVSEVQSRTVDEPPVRQL